MEYRRKIKVVETTESGHKFVFTAHLTEKEVDEEFPFSRCYTVTNSYLKSTPHGFIKLTKTEDLTTC